MGSCILKSVWEVKKKKPKRQNHSWGSLKLPIKYSMQTISCVLNALHHKVHLTLITLRWVLSPQFYRWARRGRITCPSYIRRALGFKPDPVCPHTLIHSVAPLPLVAVTEVGKPCEGGEEERGFEGSLCSGFPHPYFIHQHRCKPASGTCWFGLSSFPGSHPEP